LFVCLFVCCFFNVGLDILHHYGHGAWGIKKDKEALSSAPIIGDLADGDNHPGKLGIKDLTALNHQNNVVWV
jgi:hypothetical protein